jgi:hypothetical protein
VLDSEHPEPSSDASSGFGDLPKRDITLTKPERDERTIGEPFAGFSK